MKHWIVPALLLMAAALGNVGEAGRGGRRSAVYVKDVRFAVKALGRECRSLLRAKGVDWKAASRRFLKEAQAVRSDAEHLALLTRLLARLRDAHAEVRRTRATYGVPSPHGGRTLKGPGMAWCRSGKRVLVKTCWSSARRVGIAPGMEVLAVNGRPAATWLAERVDLLRETTGLATVQHALFAACHRGLAETLGTRVDYTLRDVDGRVRRRTVVCDRAGLTPAGAAYPPRGLRGDRDVRYGKTPRGYGYVDYRRCKSSVPYRTEDALRALGAVPGLILDFRAAEGGGFSREDFVGRFVPAGKTLGFNRRFASRGEIQYGGPIVAIVDAGTRGAAEIACGLLKEDGRAYLIGESATAGAAASQRTLDLPSGLYQLHVSVASAMRRFNAGRGIEGVGIRPHEVVDYAREDLVREEDTLIKRAEAILREWPAGVVPYVPERFGWRAAPRGR